CAIVGSAKARVMTVAAMVIAARRRDRDSSTSEKSFRVCLENGGDTRFRKGVLLPIYSKTVQSRHLRLIGLSEPAPEGVEHDDNGGKHNDRSEGGIDEALSGGLRLLRQRPEDVGD